MERKYPNLYQRARLSTGMSQERAAELRETMAAIYQVIYSGAKKERPEAANSERSGEKVCGIGSTTVGCINYSTRSTLHASPNFRREGGASL